ncbi:MAG: hypothetical protein H6974_09160 [Gammaproteobacteria bacterium]|nr:hypothetical protein [Gammaproteobacteria bacterium]
MCRLSLRFFHHLFLMLLALWMISVGTAATVTASGDSDHPTCGRRWETVHRFVSNLEAVTYGAGLYVAVGVG